MITKAEAIEKIDNAVNAFVTVCTAACKQFKNDMDGIEHETIDLPGDEQATIVRYAMAMTIEAEQRIARNV